MKNKLKPVVFVQGEYAYNAQDTSKQIMLLKALKVTQDPNKLRELIGVRAVADVYRTLDKIAMRKEYHSALARLGISFDYIVKNIKSEIDGGEKASDRLTALKMLLQSLGMDKYDETAIGGGGWEDVLQELREKKEKNGKEDQPSLKEYKVEVPEMPESVKKAKEEANKDSKELYD